MSGIPRKIHRSAVVVVIATLFAVLWLLGSVLTGWLQSPKTVHSPAATPAVKVVSGVQPVPEVAPPAQVDVSMSSLPPDNTGVNRTGDVCACFPESVRPGGSSATTLQDDPEQLRVQQRFEQEIRPILVNHCYQCHGPDRQDGGIRFDQRNSSFSAAASGATPVVPGDPGKSEICIRISDPDVETRMPRDSDPLSEEQVAVIRRWVEDGAEWPSDVQHWAFRKPVLAARPDVRNAAWCRNDLDFFVLAKLDAEGLEPAPEADRVTLVRRLTLDLTGLPPTLAEIDDYLADERENAFESVVDRLLASPHFGEKWAMRWLDLARYADTDGFELDGRRTMWLYRDWVIDALNQDLPYDQFTIQQLAGDLLPNATADQIVATGFMRSGPIAPDIGQHRFEMIVDRVNTLGTTWLSMTLGCAQCHNHKFDPVSQQEYYQLYAIFNSGADECSGGKYTGPRITATSPLNGTSAETLVMAERTDPMVTHLKVRGAFDNDGPVVEPGSLNIIHPPGFPVTDRLRLACWITDSENPLTSRVMVNRLWESLFGIGIVRTSEDFGMRGERPSHPELLDYLATEFQRRDWSIKTVLRQIVTSATYRQTSRVTEDAYRRDPENRLLARGARFRVDAELVRDIVMASSGLLSLKLGGPSVFPEQPAGTTEKREFGAFVWTTDVGEDRYRRSLYTFWKRAAPYPSLVVFDAPGRMLSCSRRGRSSIPLQVLTTLNDPVFFNAAVHLGRRMVLEGGDTVRSRIMHAFRLCVSRMPEESELGLLEDLYRGEHTRFQQSPDAGVTQLGGQQVLSEFQGLDLPEWAASSTVANVILNLDEIFTRE